MSVVRKREMELILWQGRCRASGQGPGVDSPVEKHSRNLTSVTINWPQVAFQLSSGKQG